MKDKLNSRQGPPITSAELHVHLCTIVKGLICKFESSAVAKKCGVLPSFTDGVPGGLFTQETSFYATNIIFICTLKVIVGHRGLWSGTENGSINSDGTKLRAWIPLYI